MTVFVHERSVHGREPVAARPAATAVPLLAAGILGAAAFAMAMYWPRVVQIWAHGTFFDSDDAMRLVEVRALLDGQSWFDMTAYRLDPPTGSSMHWSRTVDLPLAILIGLFRRFTDPGAAETLTRLVFPFALLLGLFAGMARLATVLFGTIAAMPAIIATLLCGCAIVQFQPGRIDHHAPQIVALIVMVGAAVAALDPAKARQASTAGVLVGLSLSISLENLPFIVCLCGMLVGVWIWHGAVMDRMLRRFAGGLAAGLVPFYAATVAPAQWFAPVCDALGAAHLEAGLVGAAGCIALSASAGRLATRRRRFIAGTVVAIMVVTTVAVFVPDCLHDPFARVDPLVRTIWMSNVTESLPLRQFFARDRLSALLFVLPVALGLSGSLIAAARLRGLLGLRFLVLAALTATGLAMAFWQIRVFTSVTPIALCGALPLTMTLHAWCLRRGREVAALLALGLVLPFTSVAWAFVLPDDGVPPRPGNSCLAAQSFTPLAALPRGPTLAPIDSGAFLLVHTGLSVYAAPYHRNNDGNRFALETLLAAPEPAVAAMRERGVAYLMLCPDLGESRRLADRAPGGLVAALLSGQVPPGLAPVAVPGTPYRVFAVSPQPGQRAVATEKALP